MVHACIHRRLGTRFNRSIRDTAAPSFSPIKNASSRCVRPDFRRSGRKYVLSLLIIDRADSRIISTDTHYYDVLKQAALRDVGKCRHGIYLTLETHRPFIEVVVDPSTRVPRDAEHSAPRKRTKQKWGTLCSSQRGSVQPQSGS